MKIILGEGSKKNNTEDELVDVQDSSEEQGITENKKKKPNPEDKFHANFNLEFDDEQIQQEMDILRKKEEAIRRREKIQQLKERAANLKLRDEQLSYLDTQGT